MAPMDLRRTIARHRLIVVCLADPSVLSYQITDPILVSL
jgi:hypothetical protein